MFFGSLYKLLYVLRELDFSITTWKAIRISGAIKWAMGKDVREQLESKCFKSSAIAVLLRSTPRLRSEQRRR